MLHHGRILAVLLASLALPACAPAQNVTATAWSLEYAPLRASIGRHIVLISGDEEYRSEEALPLLAQILSRQHGCRCTVLFAIDPQSRIIQPNCQTNIPGLEALDSADLMILFTRFRNLPPDQMRHVDGYLRAGRPVLGIRTSTHAFKLNASSPYARFSNGYDGPEVAWHGGFGRLVLGEQWIAHHGEHQQQGTRGVLASDARQHPVLRGLADGDVSGATDVYQVRLPLPADCQTLMLGQVTRRRGEFDERDIAFGMSPQDPVDLDDAKNNPCMPIAWTNSYHAPGGKTGRAMTSTIGASVDLLQPGTRRLLVNAVYWCLGLENQIPAAGTNVDISSNYKPTQFQFRSDVYWQELSLTPRRVAERMGEQLEDSEAVASP